MKFFFDLLPVILFFAVFRWADSHVDAAQSLMSHYFGGLVSGGQVTATQAPILLATIVIIVTTFAQIAYLLVRRKKIEAPLWVSLVVIVLFGGATIYFHDADFIKWKPTVLYWCFSAALLISQTLFKKNLIRAMMQANLELPDIVWNKLGWAWGVFFLAMGVLNLFLAFVLFREDTAAWVNFKLFGFTGLMLIFIVGQAFYLSKYLKDAK